MCARVGVGSTDIVGLQPLPSADPRERPRKTGRGRAGGRLVARVGPGRGQPEESPGLNKPSHLLTLADHLLQERGALLSQRDDWIMTRMEASAVFADVSRKAKAIRLEIKKQFEEASANSVRLLDARGGVWRLSHSGAISATPPPICGG